MPYFLITKNLPDKNSYTGFSRRRVRVPLANAPPIPARFGQVPPVQAMPPATTSLPSRSRSRKGSRGQQYNSTTSRNCEREDAIARVANLNNFDPNQIASREKRRKSQARRLSVAIATASAQAFAAAAHAHRQHIDAGERIASIVAAAERAREAAADVAVVACEALPTHLAAADAAIRAELARQARVRAAGAAGIGASAAAGAAAAMAALEPALRPVLEYVAKEQQRVMMEEIQQRVVHLMHKDNSGIDCDLLRVDLIHFEIKLVEQIQFVAGKAEIKPASAGLMDQLACAKKCITQTCREFGVADMHWKVEGRTAVSKKSKDGGKATSNGRARAVSADLGRKGIDTATLHPEGCGCYKPPADRGADPRRVEIHVLSKEEAAHARARRRSYHDLTVVANK